MRAPLLALCSTLVALTACSQTPPSPKTPPPTAVAEKDEVAEDCVESHEVQRVMAARKQGFLSCYADAVALDPALRGTVTLAFVIPPSGKVDRVAITESELDSASLHECIAEVAAGLQFEQATCSLPRDIEYSVSLKRGSSEFVSSKD